jgi:hypothetical protein
MVCGEALRQQRRPWTVGSPSNSREAGWRLCRPVIWKPGQHVSEPGLRIDFVHLAGLDQGIRTWNRDLHLPEPPQQRARAMAVTG